jgi:hypothetical protein
MSDVHNVNKQAKAVTIACLTKATAALNIFFDTPGDK